MPTTEWTPRNHSFQIDFKQYHRKTLATIACISERGGVELVKSYNKSVNIDKFIEYLRALRRKHPYLKMALFMDQLSVHKSRQVLDVMRQLKFEHIYNASYSPDYNPIENAIGMAKLEIKRARLRAVAANKHIDLPQVVSDSFYGRGRETCVKFIKHSS